MRPTPSDPAQRLRPLFIGASLLLALLLGVFAYALAKSQDQQRSDLEKRFNDRAEVAAAVNEALFSLATSQVAAIDAQQFGAPKIDKAALVARTTQNRGAYGVILSGDGKALAATPGAPSDLASHDVVQQALKSKRTEYSSLIDGPGGAPVIESATAFQTASGLRVDVAASPGSVITSFLNSFLGKLPSVKDARSYVLDPQLKVLATPGVKAKAGVELPDRDLATALKKKDMHGTYDGNRYFTSAPIAGTPWRIVVTASKTSLYSGVNSTVPWVIFGAFVLMSALGLFLMRRVLTANAQLERADLSRRHALEINDNVVQRLVLAKYALDRGATETSQQKLAETLRETQQLVTSLLEEEEIAPGTLRREIAAPTEGPPEPPERPVVR